MPALLGFLLVGASVATVIIGTSHANRPHEVKGEALFAVLLVAHGIVCVVVLWFLLVAWRSRGEKALRLVHVVPTLFASGYSGLVLYFLAMITRDFLR